MKLNWSNISFIKIYSIAMLVLPCLGCSYPPTKAHYTRDEGVRPRVYYAVDMPSFNLKDGCISYKFSYRLDSCFNVQESTYFSNGLHCQKGDTIVYWGMTLLRSAELNDCWDFKKPYFPSDDYRACLHRIAQDTLINEVQCKKCYVYHIENLQGNEYPLSFYYDPDRRLMIAIVVIDTYSGHIRIKETIQRIE